MACSTVGGTSPGSMVTSGLADAFCAEAACAAMQSNGPRRKREILATSSSFIDTDCFAQHLKGLSTGSSHLLPRRPDACLGLKIAHCTPSAKRQDTKCRTEPERAAGVPESIARAPARQSIEIG